MSARRVTRAQGLEDEAPLSPGMSREERRELLGDMAFSHIDQEGRDLAALWGVQPGSERWVELMTRLITLRSMGQDVGAPVPSSHGEGNGEEEEDESEGEGSHIVATGDLNDAEVSSPRSSAKLQKLADTDVSSLKRKPKSLADAGLRRRSNREDSALATSATFRNGLGYNIPSLRHSSLHDPEYFLYEPAPDTSSTLTASRQRAVPGTGFISGSTLLRRPSPELTPDDHEDEVEEEDDEDDEDDGNDDHNDDPKSTRRHICPYEDCKYHISSFKRTTHRDRHVSVVHDKVIEAECPNCGFELTRKDNLAIHLKTCKG